MEDLSKDDSCTARSLPPFRLSDREVILLSKALIRPPKHIQREEIGRGIYLEAQKIIDRFRYASSCNRRVEAGIDLKDQPLEVRLFRKTQYR